MYKIQNYNLYIKFFFKITHLIVIVFLLRAESQVLNGFLCNGCNKNYKTDRGLQKHKCKNAINSTNITVDDVPDDVPTTLSVPTTGSLTTGSLSVESSSQTSDRPRRLTRSQRN